MEFRKYQPWARDVFIRVVGQFSVLNGIARCIAEERVLIIQLLRKPTTGRVTVLQHPKPSLQDAYDWFASGDALPVLPHNDYFIVASAPALAQAEIDGLPYMRILREASTYRQAEVLRVPISMPADGVQADA